MHHKQVQLLAEQELLFSNSPVDYTPERARIKVTGNSVDFVLLDGTDSSKTNAVVES